MKPIGLTYKSDGELMVVHLCLNCKKISCNRIAGDDNPYIILRIMEEHNNIKEEVFTSLTTRGIKILNQEDRKNVLSILYGYNYVK